MLQTKQSLCTKTSHSLAGVLEAFTDRFTCFQIIERGKKKVSDTKPSQQKRDVGCFSVGVCALVCLLCVFFFLGGWRCMEADRGQTGMLSWAQGEMKGAPTSAPHCIECIERGAPSDDFSPRPVQGCQRPCGALYSCGFTGCPWPVSLSNITLAG